MTVAKFAKEIDKDTAEVLAILKSRGDEIKGSNTISDEQIEFVKSKIGKTGKPAEAEAVKKEEKVQVKEQPVKTEVAAEKPQQVRPAGDRPMPKKKPGIIIVKGGSNQRKPQGARPDGNRPNL